MNRELSDEDVRALIRDELRSPVMVERVRDLIKVELYAARALWSTDSVTPPKRWWQFLKGK